MSMYMLTILQFIGMLAAYIVVTLILPWLFLRKHMARFSVPEQLMIYFLAGNFYVIYLVFLMQFLHISCRATLIAGTAVPFVWRFIRRERGKLSGYAEQCLLQVQYVLRGELGIKSLFCQIRQKTIGKWRAGKGKKIIQYLPDILLTAAVVAGVLYVYGGVMFHVYGYKASDIPVHNYWINMMCDNKVFGAGVYPYGFHCMIYYLHEVFGIKTYVLLRVFALVQTIFIHLAVLLVLKGLCRSRYTPYFGIGCYLMVQMFRANTFSRYASTLPQEYGMLFIFPAAYFAIRFFWDYAEKLKSEKQAESVGKQKKNFRVKRKQEDNAVKECADIKEHDANTGQLKKKKVFFDKHQKNNIKKEKKKISIKGIIAGAGGTIIAFWDWLKTLNPYLVWYAISFSLTLTVHFYNTMIIGVFCIAIALGFFFRFLRWKYFRRVVTAALLGILISVIPMAVGVAMGRGLQGSLYWGMNVISGSGSDTDTDANININTDEATKKTTITDKDGNIIVVVGDLDEETIRQIKEGAYDSKTSSDTPGNGADTGNSSGNGIGNENTGVDATKNGEIPAEKQQEASVSAKEKIRNILDKAETVVKEKETIIYRQIKEYVFAEGPYQDLEVKAFLAGIAGLFIFGLISILCRHRDYGGMLWSVGWYGLLMCGMQALHALGLPQLMDPARNSIFFAYSIGLIWALDLDAVLYLIFGWLKRPIIMNLFSLAILVGAGYQVVEYDLVRQPVTVSALEKNEAITCLSNIMHEEKDHTWTIFSANDELRMIEEYGYHYEMITFLRELKDLDKNKEITVPTQDVYFFIEKKPVNYASSANALEGTSISEEYANKPVSTKTGIFCYQGEERWNTMSHMYYWAQKFKQLYPNEMQVYYETDEFVCYKLHQNSYSLYNLAIDYGYNDPQDTEE